MSEIIFDLHIDGRTVFNIAFFGTLGVTAAKYTIKVVKKIAAGSEKAEKIFND